MPAGINHGSSRGANASVIVAAESFERVCALVRVPPEIGRKLAGAAHSPSGPSSTNATCATSDYQTFAALRGRPPLAPLERAAAAFAGDLTRPATRANSRAIQARVPKTPATRAGT